MSEHLYRPIDRDLWPQHLVEALGVSALGESMWLADGSEGDIISRAHARLMMERDLRGLKLPECQ